MSKAEIDRFVNDLKSKADLLAEVRANAAGVASVVEIARRHGYDISVAEAKAYIQSNTTAELTNDQLDAVAGGKTSISTETVVVTIEAVETVTTTQAEAEIQVTV